MKLPAIDPETGVSELLLATAEKTMKTRAYHRETDKTLRVSFDLDMKTNQIRAFTAEAASPSCESASQEDFNSIWWNQDELTEIWQREQSVCNFYKHSEDDYTEQVRRVFSRCSSSRQSTINNDISDFNNSFCLQQANSDDDLDLKLKRDVQLEAARSSNRGLESRLVSLLTIYRRKVIRGVLETQNEVRHLNPEQRSQMIRSRSTFMTRAARNMALILAEADAMVAETTLKDHKRTLHLFHESFMSFSESFRLLQ
jgi:hypothetical protein